MQNKRGALRSTAVRPHNRRLILQILRAAGSQPRTSLGESSGLSAAAVTNVVNDLMADGLVIEHIDETSQRRVGRPASTVSLATDSRVVAALHIGAGRYQVGVCDLEANMLATDSATFPTRQSADVVLASAADAVTRVLKTAGVDPERVLGLGVGTAGLVDETRRINLVSANSGWFDVPVADIVEHHLDIGAVVEHNVRAMAAGEARYGLGVGFESLTFLYARTGLGLAFVFDGKPYRGGSLGSHEIGHLPVVGNVAPCLCGKTGCLETIVSDGAIAAAMADGSGTGGSGRPDVPPEAASMAAWNDYWIAALRNSDPQALAARDRVVEALAPPIANIAEMLNPQRFVLGGLLAGAGAAMAAPLQEAVSARVTPWLRDTIDIQPTAFGASSGLVGAATVALDHFLFGAPIIEPKALAEASAH